MRPHNSNRNSKKFPFFDDKLKEIEMLEEDLEDLMTKAVDMAGKVSNPIDQRLDILEIFTGYKMNKSLERLLQSSPRVTRYKITGYTYYAIETADHYVSWVFYDRGYCTCDKVMPCEHVYLLDVWLTHALEVVDGRTDVDSFALGIFNITK